MPPKCTPNPYRIEGDTAILTIVNRHGSPVAETFIDAEDVPQMQIWRGALSAHGYAVASRVIDGVSRQYKLHRVILGTEWGDKRLVDHINRNKLDNRKANLRYATQAENSQNREQRTSSRYTGVSFSKATGLWHTQGYHRHRCFFLGRYATEDEASTVATRWREDLAREVVMDDQVDAVLRLAYAALSKQQSGKMSELDTRRAINAIREILPHAGEDIKAVR